jgi:hypothetical protein
MINYDDIAPAIRKALDRWGAGQSHPTGDFLRAVLSNELMEAVGRADETNLATLASICSYVYCELPGRCHGSPEKYTAWMQLSRDNDAAKRGVAACEE